MLSREYEIITEAQTLKKQLILMKKISMINARDTPLHTSKSTSSLCVNFWLNFSTFAWVHHMYLKLLKSNQ